MDNADLERRLGREEPVQIDVRVMAATNRDLQDEIAADRFRRDLDYRLSVVTLDVPTLRDHQEDVRQAVVSACEQSYFTEQLRRTGGAIDETARIAGINPRSLYDVLKRHGLKKEAFRGET